MKLSPGVGYTSANLGEASGITVDAPFESSARNIGRQFECSITGAKVGDSYEYRLHVRKGLVEFDYYISDEKGIIDLNDLGGISGRKCQNMFFYMNKFNVFPEGSRTEGTEEKSEFFSKNGFIKLTPGKNYFVFLYKTTPDWKESNDLWEAKAPQIGISGDVDEPNNFIRTQRNGGGFLQSYIRLDGASTTDNVVVSNSIGVIASLDTGELNNHISFNTGLLDIVRSRGTATPENPHKDQYPEALSNELGDNIPTFLDKSTNPYMGSYGVDGDSISGVPTGENWAKGNAGGGGAVTYIDGGPGTFFAQYWNETNSFNYIADNVIVGRDISSYYTPLKTELNLITGLINVNDFEIIIHNDLSADRVISFKGSIEIKADNVTTIKTSGEMTDAGTGYVYTDCYRQDIAYIEWNAALNRFQIYQMQYGPIKLRQNPLGSFKNKLLKSPTEEARWDSNFDLCDDITGDFSGYTKDLNHGYYVPPAPAQQIAAYAGQIAIGEYQNPKETL